LFVKFNIFIIVLSFLVVVQGATSIAEVTVDEEMFWIQENWDFMKRLLIRILCLLLVYMNWTL